MSGESGGKVVFDADVQKFVKETEKATSATKKMVDSASKEMGAALEKQFDNVLRRQAIFAETLRRGLQMAGRFTSGLVSSATQASQAQGSNIVDMTTAAADMRARNPAAVAERILGEKGTASAAERLQFMQGMHSLQMEGAVTTPGGRVFERQPRLNDEEMVKLGRMFSQGGSVLYGQGGSALIDAMRRTRDVDRAVAFLRQKDRRGGAFENMGESGTPLANELSTRVLENAAATSYGNSDIGYRARRGEAVRTMDAAVSGEAYIRKTVVDTTEAGKAISQMREGKNSGDDMAEKIVEQLQKLNDKTDKYQPGRLDLSASTDRGR